MNNKILAARRPSPLVRIWRSTGDYRMPLACVWVKADVAKLCLNPPDSSSDETGGLGLCA
jgi:hypothetical protein